MNNLLDLDSLYLGPPGTGSIQNGVGGTLKMTSNRRESGGSMDDYDDLDTNLENMGFEQWFHTYMTSNAELLEQTTEDVSNRYCKLRDQFQAEQRILCDLYRAIEEVTDVVLQKDTGNRSIQRYMDWGRFRKKEYLRFMFNNDGFRAQYSRHRFKNSAISMLQALALRILPETPELESYLSEIRYVVSVGVGPASDIAGFVAYLRARGYNNRLHYFALDQCEEWRVYIETCDHRWAQEYNVSLWFKKGKISTTESLSILPDADMIVFSYTNTALMDPNIWSTLCRRYRFVLVLDGTRANLTNVFGKHSFKQFELNERTSVYYHFCQELVEVATREEEKHVGLYYSSHDDDAVFPSCSNNEETFEGE